MDKKEQIEIIDRFLKKKYGLNIDNWVSLNEFISSSYTLSENVGRVKEILLSKISDRENEIFNFIGSAKFQMLENDLTDNDPENAWNKLLEEHAE